MGRVTVREAIQQFLAAAAIPNVGTVFPARPEIVQEEDYELAEQQYTNQRLIEASQTTAGSNAVLVVNLTEDKRQRRAMTGRGAVNDTRIHRTELEVYLACTSGEAVRAQVDYDAIVDSIVELIRDNPILSAPGVVWSAGEYTAGVQHHQALPFTGPDGMTVFVHGLVTWDTWEWIAGNTGFVEPTLPSEGTFPEP